MSDSTGNQSHGRPDQPDADAGQQPSVYPPPTGQPAPPYGQQPGTPSPYEQPAQPYGQPGSTEQYGQQYGEPAYAGTPVRRPGTVTTAAVITLLSSGLTLLLALVILVAAAVVPDDYVDGVRSSDPAMGGMTEDSLLAATMAFSIVLAIWCVAAMVLAVLVLRRSNGARIGLVVSASVSAVVSLALILALFPLVTLIASIVTIVCLFAGGANAWFAGRSGHQATGGPLSSPVA